MEKSKAFNNLSLFRDTIIVTQGNNKNYSKIEIIFIY